MHKGGHRTQERRVEGWHCETFSNCMNEVNSLCFSKIQEYLLFEEGNESKLIEI